MRPASRSLPNVNSDPNSSKSKTEVSATNRAETPSAMINKKEFDGLNIKFEIKNFSMVFTVENTRNDICEKWVQRASIKSPIAYEAVHVISKKPTIMQFIKFLASLKH